MLTYAMATDRVLVTLNRKHFVRLHGEWPHHPGIVVCSLDADFAALAKRIHDALAENADMSGKLVRVNRPRR